MIFLAKFLILLKRLIAAFFVSIVFKPGRILLRFFFYKVAVKSYKLYLFVAKKIGWPSLRDSSIWTLISQKAVHFLVVFLTIILVFYNLTSKTRAEAMIDLAGTTILADLVESEFGDIEEEQIIEEFSDEEANISPVRQNYLDNFANVKNEPKARFDDADEGTVGTITQGGGALIKPDIASTKKTPQPRTKIINHTVQPGDTISTIAEKYGITVSTLLWENNLSSYSIIRPGDKLSILPVSGVTHNVARGENLSSISKKYGISQEEIFEANGMTDSSRIAVGQELVIPGGTKTSFATRASSRYSGISAIIDLVKAPGASPIAGNAMNWPTVGHRISQYFSWRHKGVDIANKIGTPIYAVDSGTVEYAGWGTGYGNTILIDHGGGKKTRYAHASKLYVAKGQKVTKGEAIMAMGSTGWSTGSHLHFEIIISGGKYNPLNYIK